MFILPYKTGSKSAATLAKALGARRIRLEGSKFVGNKNKTVINWGCSNSPVELGDSVVINEPAQIEAATNKLTFFQVCEGEVSIPEFTLDIETARNWLADVKNSKPVVVREKLTGSGGEGIVLLETLEEFEAYNHDQAKLYVKYIPKKDEFRVHVFGGEVALVQRKAADRAHPDPDWKIRNHDNGFVFVKNEDFVVPEDVTTQAIKAMNHLQLHFGAVDVIYNEYHKKAYVLEINTAPGLEGTTVDTYVENVGKLVEMLTGRRLNQDDQAVGGEHEQLRENEVQEARLRWQEIVANRPAANFRINREPFGFGEPGVVEEF